MNGWEWRKAGGGWTFRTDHSDGERRFHAYDSTDTAACEPLGLARSAEEPNEGSDLCPACMEIVRRVAAA